MGRQIIFFQLHQDVERLFNVCSNKDIVLYDCKGKLVENYASINFEQYFISGTKDFVGQYFIGHKNTPFDNSLAEKIKYPSFCGQLIEFVPTRISKERKNYYNEGRFYLSDDLYGDEELVKIYNFLVRYIKKNYKYDKFEKTYFSPNFYDLWLSGSLVPCNFDNPYKKPIN